MIDTNNTSITTDNAVPEAVGDLRERFIYGVADAVVVALVAVVVGPAVFLLGQFRDGGAPAWLWAFGLGHVAYLAVAGVLRVGTRRFAALDPGDDDEECAQVLSRLPVLMVLFMAGYVDGVPMWLKMTFLAGVAHEAAAYCVRTWLRNRLVGGKA